MATMFAMYVITGAFVQSGGGNVVTCEADGLWSLPEAHCQVMCPRPPLVKDAAMVTRSCSHDNHKVGTRCRFKCSKGFHVAGMAPRK